MLNLPNKITLIRILLIPVFMVFLLSRSVLDFLSISLRWGAIIAGVVFSLAALTDTLDGYVARAKGQITMAGHFLDPLADKLLVSAALISLVGLGRLSAWIAMVIIGREFAVMGLRMAAAAKNITIASSQWGKLKTLSQILAIAVIIFRLQELRFGLLVEGTLVTIAVVLTVASGIEYFVRALTLLTESRT